jgi:hypothetical protein
MTGPEPTLGQVRDELKADLRLDSRVREVEIQQAVTTQSIDGVRHEVAGIAASQQQARQETREMRTEILAAIEAHKPPRVTWAAVLSSIVAAVALLLVVAQALYGG